MMDGQVAVIRAALDAEGFTDTLLLAYAAKYASAFYGPFREAVDSQLQGDRRTYQLDPGNRREGVREAVVDETEGADIVMVKPAMAFLDVLREVRDTVSIPVWAYPGVRRVRDDRGRRRERLDRPPGRRARIPALHPPRGCRCRADLLGDRGRRLAARLIPPRISHDRPQ